MTDSALIFGTYTINEGYVSYSCPLVLPEETMKKISFAQDETYNNSEDNNNIDNKDNEVKHNPYFGKNIREAIDVLKGK